jgi:hypothetical protein
MAITVECGCGKRFRVKDEHAGKRGRCPSCGAVVAIPAAEPAGPGGPSPERAGPAGPRRAAEPGARAPQAAGPEICPECGRPLAGGAVLCVNCGYDTRTGERVGTAGRSDWTPLPDVRPYRDWSWLIYVLCLLGGGAALLGGMAAGVVTIHRGFSEELSDLSWELLKASAFLFGGLIGGAFVGGVLARILPR